MTPKRHADGRLELVFEQEIPGPTRLVLRFAEIDGAIACVNIEIGSDFTNETEPEPKPITTALVRSIPIARVIEQSLWATIRSLQEGGAAPVDRRSVDVILADETLDTEPMKYGISTQYADALAAKVGAGIEQAKQRPGRPPQYDDEHFAEVARVYHEHSGGRAPRKAVAKRFDISDSTAAKWIARAREKGLLEPFVP
jgi:hypothetical protein